MPTFSELQPGDWFEMRYGIDIVCCYVTGVDDAFIRYGHLGWSSCLEDVHLKHLEPDFFKYLGRGRRRWWWRLLPWRNSVCPFSKPYTVRAFEREEVYSKKIVRDYEKLERRIERFFNGIDE